MTQEISPWALILQCKTCHKRPVDKPDETFHWDAGKLDTCICTTCLERWFVEEMGVSYYFDKIMNGEDLFEKK